MATRDRPAVGDCPGAMPDDLPAGHLRRMIDLSEQLPDDWSRMMGRTAMRKDVGALRFELASSSYALAPCPVHADLTIGNAWQRGDWRVRISGTTVATGDSTDVTAGHGQVSARRDDNRLLMQLLVSGETAIQLDWAA